MILCAINAHKQGNLTLSHSVFSSDKCFIYFIGLWKLFEIMHGRALCNA